ncbi:MAG: response regulator [Thermoproteota archaeon]|nr:response regulator [Thermoproteota archaeon]
MRKGKKAKIMVVDDDLEISNLLKMALHKQGYDVFGFTDPLLALEHFKINYNACSLVISDLRMPGMDGFKLLRNIKLLNPKTKALLMTAFDIHGDTKLADDEDNVVIDDFIQKPVPIKKLCALVDSHLKNKTG